MWERQMWRQLLQYSFALATLMGAPSPAVAQSDASLDARTARATAERQSCVVTVDFIPFEFCARDLALPEDEVAVCRDLHDRREPCFAIMRRTCDLVGGRVVEVVDRMDGTVRWPMCESDEPRMAIALEFARTLLSSMNSVDADGQFYFRSLPAEVADMDEVLASAGGTLKSRTASYFITSYVEDLLQARINGGERRMGITCSPANIDGTPAYNFAHPSAETRGASMPQWCAFASYCALGMAIPRDDPTVDAAARRAPADQQESIRSLLAGLAQGVDSQSVWRLNRATRSDVCTELRADSEVMIELEDGIIPFDNALALLLVGFDRVSEMSGPMNARPEARRLDLDLAIEASIAMLDQLPARIGEAGTRARYEMQVGALVASTIFANVMVDRLLAERGASLSDFADLERPGND